MLQLAYQFHNLAEYVTDRSLSHAYRLPGYYSVRAMCENSAGAGVGALAGANRTASPAFHVLAVQPVVGYRLMAAGDGVTLSVTSWTLDQLEVTVDGVKVLHVLVPAAQGQPMALTVSGEEVSRATGSRSGQFALDVRAASPGTPPSPGTGELVIRTVLDVHAEVTPPRVSAQPPYLKVNQTVQLTFELQQTTDLHVQIEYASDSVEYMYVENATSPLVLKREHRLYGVRVCVRVCVRLCVCAIVCVCESGCG